MDDPFVIYLILNRIEGMLWWGIAVAIPYKVKAVTTRQKISVWAASVGFFFFGITDFIEAPLRGQLPWWLWAFKIVCAAFILACRFNYIGWRRFRFTDRYFLFGIFCLFAAVGVMLLQHYLYAGR